MNFHRPLKPLFSPLRIAQTAATFTSSTILRFTRPTVLTTTLVSDKMATNGPVLPESLSTPSTASEPILPKLTPQEFRIYNRMAEHMDYYHNHFRETWNILYAACEMGKRSKGMSIRQFINLGQQFCSQLEMHHGIEERRVNTPCIALCV